MKLLIALAFLAVASARPDVQPVQLPEPVVPEIGMMEPEAVKVADIPIFGQADAPEAVNVVDGPIEMPEVFERISIGPEMVPEEVMRAVAAAEAADAPQAVNVVDGPLEMPEAFEKIDFSPEMVPEEVMQAIAAAEAANAPEQVNVVDAPINEMPEIQPVQLPQPVQPEIGIIEPETVKIADNSMFEQEDAVHFVDAPINEIPDWSSIDFGLLMVPEEVLRAVAAENLAESPEIQPVHLPEAPMPYVEAEDIPAEAVNVVNAPINEEVPEIQPVHLPQSPMPDVEMEDAAFLFDTPIDAAYFVYAPVILDAAPIYEEPAYMFEEIAPSEVKVVESPEEVQEVRHDHIVMVVESPSPNQYDPSYPAHLQPNANPMWR